MREIVRYIKCGKMSNMKLPESILSKIKENTRLFDDMASSSGIEAVETYNVEEIASELYADLMAAREALKEIKLAGHSDHAKMRIIANQILSKLDEKYGNSGKE